MPGAGGILDCPHVEVMVYIRGFLWSLYGLVTR